MVFAYFGIKLIKVSLQLHRKRTDLEIYKRKTDQHIRKKCDFLTIFIGLTISKTLK